MGASKHNNAMATSVVYYGACSSVMLVVNKVTLSLIPLPGLVFVIQFLTTVAVVLGGKVSGHILVDDISRAKAAKFAPYVFIFVAALYCNGKVLQHSNIETLIVFRAASPLFVGVLDYVFLGREFPGFQSTVSLLGLLAGSVGYVLCDSEFQMHGIGAYAWVSAYVIVIVFEMTFAKHTIMNVEFDSPIWGSVLYNNALASPLMLVLALGTGEASTLSSFTFSTFGLAMLLLCSVLGVGMNWSGWNCRNQLSAASYTLLGVVCKIFSVLLNICLWDKHASTRGILWLGVCLFSSSIYKQAPLRTTFGDERKACK